MLKKIFIKIFILLLWVSSISTQDIFEEEKGIFSTAELQLKLETYIKNQLSIKSTPELRGKINIVAEPIDYIKANYFIKVKTKTQSKAYDYIDLVAVAISKTYEGTLLALRAPNPVPWNTEHEQVSIFLEISVPDSCVVDIEALYFDIDASGPLKGITIPGSLGRLNIFDVAGKVELVTSNQKLMIEKISGDINVSTRNARLEAINITSKENQAYFKNDGGEILIDNFTGLLNVKNSYAKIDIENFVGTNGNSFIRSFSGPVILDIKEMRSGQMVILNKFEDIEIMVPTDISADFSLSVEEDGRIEASNFKFKPNLIETNRLNFIARDGKAVIKSSITGEGNILLLGTSDKN